MKYPICTALQRSSCFGPERGYVAAPAPDQGRADFGGPGNLQQITGHAGFAQRHDDD
jgi:hypothetical protein